MEVLVFLGIQGSGKGTQAKLLADKLGYTHINIGDLFRKHISEGTPLGAIVSNIIKNGDLVQDDLVFELINATITGRCKGLIFDGFPRTLPQAEFLMRHYEVKRVFYLDLSEEAAIRRISSRLVCKDCGTNFNAISHKPIIEGVCDVCSGKLYNRPDDNPQAIHKRFKEFYRETYPLKSFFSKQGLLLKLDADRPIMTIIDQIYQDLSEVL